LGSPVFSFPDSDVFDIGCDGVIVWQLAELSEIIECVVRWWFSNEPSARKRLEDSM
jgi:hypothetical protein